jgi:hypothetical protein
MHRTDWLNSLEDRGEPGADEMTADDQDAFDTDMRAMLMADMDAVRLTSLAPQDIDELPV